MPIGLVKATYSQTNSSSALTVSRGKAARRTVPEKHSVCTESLWTAVGESLFSRMTAKPLLRAAAQAPSSEVLRTRLAQPRALLRAEAGPETSQPSHLSYSGITPTPVCDSALSSCFPKHSSWLLSTSPYSASQGVQSDTLYVTASSNIRLTEKESEDDGGRVMKNAGGLQPSH